MARSETRRCGNCAWLLAQELEGGECRRLPPSMQGWPIVVVQASCGEWQAGSFADWTGSEFSHPPEGAQEGPRGRFGRFGEALGGLATKVADGGRATAAQASQIGRSGIDELSRWSNAVLATDFVVQIDRHMRDVFSSGKATVYDKAMDAVYNNTRIGGGDHRLFDGGHDLLGAWNAVASAAHEKGDTFTEQVGHYFGALWKDMATPKGLPIVTWDKETFKQVSTALSDQFGIAPGVVSLEVV